MKKPTNRKPSTNAGTKKTTATTKSAKKAAKAGKGKRPKALTPWEQFVLFVLVEMSSGPLGEAGIAIRDYLLPELGKIFFGFKSHTGMPGRLSPARRRQMARTPYGLDIVRAELSKLRARAVLRTCPESFELIAPELARIVVSAEIGVLDKKIRAVLQAWMLDIRTGRARGTAAPRRP